MTRTIALAGNPNSGKSTLFNRFTGSRQSVGNWPGVTLERKVGRLRGHTDVEIVDLPGVYSLSAYTLEERVARDCLLDSVPDCIIDIVDGTNLERNLFLTTQLLELGIPVVIAINMIDLVHHQGKMIDVDRLSQGLGVPVIAISASHGTGIDELIDAALVVPTPYLGCSHIRVSRMMFSARSCDSRESTTVGSPPRYSNAMRSSPLGYRSSSPSLSYWRS